MTMKPDIHRRCVTRCSGGRRLQLDAAAVGEPARPEGFSARGGGGSWATLRACRDMVLGTRECRALPHPETTRHVTGPAMAIDLSLITPADVMTLHADRSAVDHSRRLVAGHVGSDTTCQVRPQLPRAEPEAAQRTLTRWRVIAAAVAACRHSEVDRGVESRGHHGRHAPRDYPAG